MLPKNGSQIASLIFAQETVYRREVWMQVSLASVYPRDIPWCGWGSKREERRLIMGHDRCGYAAISYALWHWKSTQVHLSCSVAGEKITQLASLITTTLIKCGKQERSGSSVSQNSWSWENGVLVMCWSHIHILQEDFPVYHCCRWWELVFCSDLVWSFLC